MRNPFYGPISVLLVFVGLLAGCTVWMPAPEGAAPEAVPPYGHRSQLTSHLTGAVVESMMLAEISFNEQQLGRALTPARIVTVERLREGQIYWHRHLDGSNPEGSGDGPNGGPGWMVEAVGTFVAVDLQTGQINALGMHGFHRWDDAGSEGTALIPCWTRDPIPAAEMEGTCTP